MLTGAFAGYYMARNLLIVFGLEPDSGNHWVQLFFVMSEIAAALPLAWWFARLVRFETLNAICKALECEAGDIIKYISD